MTVSLLHSVSADGSFSAAGAAAWDAQHVLTQATDRLLGRTTAGVGATEEITVGSGLSLSAGTLTATGTSMVYPGAGIANSTGSAWGTSYTTTGSGTVVALATSPSFITPILGVPQSADFSTGTFTWPTFNQNTTGTAANVTGTVAVGNGGTGATTLTGVLKGNGTSAFTAASAGTDYVAPGAFTTSGLTMATARLLGRTTAGTGAPEEILAGTGLTLSAGSLSVTSNTYAPATAATAAVGYTINGNGAVITTGVVGVGLTIPFAATINSVTLQADQTGSIVIDIWKDSYANFPPTVTDSICASAKPTISASNKSLDTTLTGWTTAIAAGDIFYFNVDSCATITNVVLTLKVTKT